MPVEFLLNPATATGISIREDSNRVVQECRERSFGRVRFFVFTHDAQSFSLESTVDADVQSCLRVLNDPQDAMLSEDEAEQFRLALQQPASTIHAEQLPQR